MRPIKGLCYLLRGKEVEASKPVPNMGTFRGGWSQWRNRLPHRDKGVACYEARLADPFGVVGTPTMAWVLGRYSATFRACLFHTIP